MFRGTQIKNLALKKYRHFFSCKNPPINIRIIREKLNFTNTKKKWRLLERYFKAKIVNRKEGLLIIITYFLIFLLYFYKKKTHFKNKKDFNLVF